MNPYKVLDKFIGRLLYKPVVSMEAKAFLKAGFTEPNALASIIYSRRPKDYKRYGVDKNDILKIVSPICEIKPLTGLKLKFALGKARKTISGAIKKKRVIFLGDNKASYTDRGFVNYKLNFEELADMFIDKTKQGFNKEQIVKIIQEEYKRSKK